MDHAIFEWEHEPEYERASVGSWVQPVATTATWADAWKFKREGPRELDRQLTSLAVGWASAMPLEDRPLQLCRQYPRVANRLALTWQDGVLTKRVLESLTLDKRGGRRGFPKEVAAELAKLAAQVAQR